VSKLNIQIFVDVIAMMTGSPVEKTVFIYDDSPSGSVGKGTHKAISAVYPGQLIQWNLYPVDVQTPAWIGGITFGPEAGQDCGGSETPWLRTWSGYAPLYMLPNYHHPYTIHLQFGATGKKISVKGPQLAFPTMYAPAPVGTDSVL
jgi:hypothetical protein